MLQCLRSCERESARNWQEAGCLGHGDGMGDGHFIGRTSKENNAQAFLEGKAGHSGCLGRVTAQRTCRKSRKCGLRGWFPSQVNRATESCMHLAICFLLWNKLQRVSLLLFKTKWLPAAL